MAVPLPMRADEGPDGTAFMQRGFQRLTVPAGNGFFHRIVVVGHAKDAQRPIAEIGEIGMQEHPAPVFRRIEFHQRRELPVRWHAGDLHVLTAAERDRRSRDIDRDILPAARFQAPEFGRGDARRGQNRGTGDADSVAGGQYRVVPGQGDIIPKTARQAPEVQQFVQSLMGEAPGCIHFAQPSI